MEFTEQELSTLNAFFNRIAELPAEVEAINFKLREHFSQDVSTEVTPETDVEANLAEEQTDPSVADESVVDPAPTEVDEPVAPTDDPVTDTEVPAEPEVSA